LTALNGVASEAIALRWFARVIGVCVWMPAVMSAPGEVVVRCGPVRALLHGSRYPAELADGADAELLETLAGRWGDAAIEVPRPPDVMPWKYRKLLGNMGNAVQALLGEGNGAEIVQLVCEEALQVYAAAGVVMNSEAEEAACRARLVIREVPGAPEQMGGSTWQSLRRGVGTVETDYLNGEIVAMAHRLGRRAPVNAVLTRLLREAAAQGTEPGSMTATDLLELVDQAR
jgi:2-dehydropantoate 2-reductase